MKKALVCDILRISLFYFALIILVFIIGDLSPSLWVLLGGYFISIGIVVFFQFYHARKQKEFEELVKKYEKHLSFDTWTRVYLKPVTPEKLGIYYYEKDNSSEKFYAKLGISPSASSHGVPNLFILITFLLEGEELRENTSHDVKYELKTFEDHFSFEET